MCGNCYIYVKIVLTLFINHKQYLYMKKLFLVLMMGLIMSPSFAQDGKGKKKHRRNNNTEVVSEVRPIHRERWVEKDGDNYVIVSRTTITKSDYLRIRNVSR
jgi:hypothetical protein